MELIMLINKYNKDYSMLDKYTKKYTLISKLFNFPEINITEMQNTLFSPV